MLSTTSVSPSHRPRGSPFHCLIARAQSRATVDRDDPRLVDHLEHHHHVARHLDDLVGVVVSGGEHAGRIAARDAADPRRLVLGRVGDVLQMEVAVVLRPLHHRHTAVGRVDNHRPPPLTDLVGVISEFRCGADVGRRARSG